MAKSEEFKRRINFKEAPRLLSWVGWLPSLSPHSKPDMKQLKKISQKMVEMLFDKVYPRSSVLKSQVLATEVDTKGDGPPPGCPFFECDDCQQSYQLRFTLDCGHCIGCLSCLNSDLDRFFQSEHDFFEDRDPEDSDRKYFKGYSDSFAWPKCPNHGCDCAIPFRTLFSALHSRDHSDWVFFMRRKLRSMLMYHCNPRNVTFMRCELSVDCLGGFLSDDLSVPCPVCSKPRRVSSSDAAAKGSPLSPVKVTEVKSADFDSESKQQLRHKIASLETQLQSAAKERSEMEQRIGHWKGMYEELENEKRRALRQIQNARRVSTLSRTSSIRGSMTERSSHRRMGSMVPGSDQGFYLAEKARLIDDLVAELEEKNEQMDRLQRDNRELRIQAEMTRARRSSSVRLAEVEGLFKEEGSDEEIEGVRHSVEPDSTSADASYGTVRRLRNGKVKRKQDELIEEWVKTVCGSRLQSLMDALRDGLEGDYEGDTDSEDSDRDDSTEEDVSSEQRKAIHELCFSLACLSYECAKKHRSEHRRLNGSVDGVPDCIAQMYYNFDDLASDGSQATMADFCLRPCQEPSSIVNLALDSLSNDELRRVLHSSQRCRIQAEAFVRKCIEVVFCMLDSKLDLYPLQADPPVKGQLFSEERFQLCSELKDRVQFGEEESVDLTSIKVQYCVMPGLCKLVSARRRARKEPKKVLLPPLVWLDF